MNQQVIQGNIALEVAHSYGGYAFGFRASHFEPLDDYPITSDVDIALVRARSSQSVDYDACTWYSVMTVTRVGGERDVVTCVGRHTLYVNAGGCQEIS